MLEQYWEEQPLEDQCERFKTGSRAWLEAREFAKLAAEREKRKRAKARKGSPSPDLVMDEEHQHEHKPEPEHEHGHEKRMPVGAEEQLQAFNSSLVGLMEALTAYAADSTSTAASTSKATSTAHETLAAKRDQAGLALLHLLHAFSPASTLPVPLKLEAPEPGPSIDERFAAMEAAHANSLAALRLKFVQREQATTAASLVREDALRTSISSLVNTKMSTVDQSCRSDLARLIESKLTAHEQSSRALVESKVAELSTSLDQKPKISPSSAYAGSSRELDQSTLGHHPDGVVSTEKFRLWSERLYLTELPQLQAAIEHRLFPRVVALEAQSAESNNWLQGLGGRVGGLETRMMGGEQRSNELETRLRGAEAAAARIIGLEKSLDVKLGAVTGNMEVKIFNLSTRVFNTPTYEKIISFVNQQIAAAQLVLPPSHAPPPPPSIPVDLSPLMHRLAAVEDLLRTAEKQWQAVENRLPELIDSRVSIAVPKEVAKVAAEARERREAREAKKRAGGADI